MQDVRSTVSKAGEGRRAADQPMEHAMRIDYPRIAPAAMLAQLGLERYVRASGLEESLLLLVKLRASYLNGCAYCVDMHSKDGRTAGLTDQKLHAVAIWQDSALFTATERAALEFTEQVTRLSETHVPEAVVDRARAELGEERLAALLTLVIAINVWNAIGVTARCWSVHRDAA